MGDERHPDPELEVVTTLPYEEALLLAGRLNADGIEAHVWPEQPSAAFSKAVIPESDVLVHKDHLEEARTIVEQYRD